ncbi:hypothetical protein [Bacillus sp. FJAT-27225]|uniref:hypothetical protein n=1 Tax=Bacillus sp. FJAT-27225 TaxID=1743144 RepID=UPI001111F856|nr:hypothetical protein [Bacillus sp. FJAT-27225]
MAAILQFTGALGGAGYAFSMAATLPIVLASVAALQTGVLAYLLAVCLLLLIQPSELIVFPFTTGLLGLSLGAALHFFRNKSIIVLFSGASLTIGIGLIVELFGFPILGPGLSSVLSPKVLPFVFLGSALYSWGWMVLSMKLISLLSRQLKRGS